MRRRLLRMSLSPPRPRPARSQKQAVSSRLVEAHPQLLEGVLLMSAEDVKKARRPSLPWQWNGAAPCTGV